jgi:hypothetical protein
VVPEAVSLEIPMLGGKRFEILRAQHLLPNSARDQGRGSVTVTLQLREHETEAQQEADEALQAVRAYAMARAMSEAELSSVAGQSALHKYASGGAGGAMTNELAAKTEHELKSLFMSALNRYGSSSIADVAVLDRLHEVREQEASAEQRQHAVRVRLSEKRVLQQLLERLTSDLKQHDEL